MINANNSTYRYITFTATYSPTLKMSDLADKTSSEVRITSWNGTLLQSSVYNFPVYNGSKFTMSRSVSGSAKTLTVTYIGIHKKDSTSATQVKNGDAVIATATSTNCYLIVLTSNGI